MDTQKRLQELLDQRNWTMYRFAKEADLSWSTVRNVLKRGTDPSISTLEIFCDALGISLAQFFDVDNESGLGEDQRRLLEMWSALDEKDRRSILSLMESLLQKK